MTGKLLFALILSTALLPASPHRVKDVSIRILSTMLADDGIGEWGFSAIVEADGHRILVDTGARPSTVLENARELGVDLASITDVVLTHNHSDHTGGLLTLRRAVLPVNRSGLSRAYVARGIFYSRPGPNAKESNPVLAIKSEYEGSGGKFFENSKPVELYPGIWLTGPVPRKYPERNWSTVGKIVTPSGIIEDNIPEDQSVVLETDRGSIVVTGCGHAGIVNTLEFARQAINLSPVHAIVGGLHLFNADDEKLAWTAGKLRDFGLKYFISAHCTGIEATYRIRELANLDRRTCVVGSVGSSYSLAKGIDPLRIAK